MWDNMHRHVIIKYNTLVDETMERLKPLEEAIMIHRAKSDEAALFNAAAQCWNWIFMWMCMWPST
jgi:superoxide dismutase